MTLINLDRIVRAVSLDEKVYSEIAEDKGTLLQAIIVVLLTMVIGGIWFIILSSWWFHLIQTLISVLISVLPIWCIKVGIMHIVAKLLGGKADFVSYFKAIGFARVPAALWVIPAIGWLIGTIWAFACYVTATKVVHRLSPGKAIIVAVIVPIILAVLIIWMRSGIFSGLKIIGIAPIDVIWGLFLLLLFSLL